MYKFFYKWLLDWLLSLVLMVLLLPVFLATTVLLFIANSGAVFYLQERPGMKLKPFYLIKFKSMSDERDQDGNLLPDKLRLHRTGKLVRNLSLDELPQLINVLLGQMSLVGPRPLLFKYVPLYSKEQNRRHEVRPGITGWAQVNGRNSISWKKKFEYDVYYVDNLSLKLDLKILWLTVVKVLKREGVNQSAERPMQPFDGTN